LGIPIIPKKMLKSKNNSISPDEFFRNLSIRANGMPEDSVRMVYYALLKVVVDQFRVGRDINMPGLGKLYVKQYKPSKGFNVNKGEIVIRKGHKEVEFVSADTLKKYINGIDIILPN